MSDDPNTQRLIRRIIHSSFASEIRAAWEEYVRTIGVPTNDDRYMEAVVEAHRSGDLTHRKATMALDVMERIDPAWVADNE